MTIKQKLKRGPKEKASTKLLRNIEIGATFPRVKIFELNEGPVDIQGEKSKLSRSMESRMTQLRHKDHNFETKRFTNQSFTTMLSDSQVMCGTVLTCVKSNSKTLDNVEFDHFNHCVRQLSELAIGDSSPIVNVLSLQSNELDLAMEKKSLDSLADRYIDAAIESEKNSLNEFTTKPFASMLVNGNIVCGVVIKRVA
jgi:hypothetical protein